MCSVVRFLGGDFCGWRSDFFAADALGEVGVVFVAEDEVGDAGFAADFVQRRGFVDQAKLVGETVGIAREEDTIVVRDFSRREGVDVAHDVGRAVVGEGVVELGLVFQLIDALEDIDEQLAGLVGCGGRAEEEHIDIAMLGPHGQQVALVGDDIDELELAQEADGRVIGLALFQADLGRDADVVAILEAEAEQGVRDGAVFGERNLDEIDAFDFGEVVGLVVVLDETVAVFSPACSTGSTRRPAPW